MKSLIKNAVAILLLLFVIQSCKNDTPVLHTSISGKANELVVVISEDSWNGQPGELIRGTLAQFQYGLPQEEPLFDIINIPPVAFQKIFKSNRNIMQVTISSTVLKPEMIIKSVFHSTCRLFINSRKENKSAANAIDSDINACP